MGAVVYRFLSEQNAYDVGVLVRCQRSAGDNGAFRTTANSADESCIRRVAAFPAIAQATRVRECPGYVATENGHSLQPDPNDRCDCGPGHVSLVADAGGRFDTSFNASRIASQTVGWQASTYTVVTLLVSLPLGIVLGRTIWQSHAGGVGVVPEPVAPWTTLAVVTFAAVAISNLVAAHPARRATRGAPAAILRTE
jgi:hypothetical protein